MPYTYIWYVCISPLNKMCPIYHDHLVFSFLFVFSKVEVSNKQTSVLLYTNFLHPADLNAYCVSIRHDNIKYSHSYVYHHYLYYYFSLFFTRIYFFQTFHNHLATSMVPPFQFHPWWITIALLNVSAKNVVSVPFFINPDDSKG